MFDLIEKGGLLMWPLICLGIIAISVFIERFLYFHRISINVSEFLHGLANLIKKHNYSEALYECAGTPGPVARVIHSALVRHIKPIGELRAIIQQAGQLEVPRLERYLNILLTITYIAPMIGLLGTVIGLIDTFVRVNTSSGFASPARLSEGVYHSLITSAGGLAIAIPTFVMFTYLSNFAKNIIHDIERGGIEIINIIDDFREEKLAEKEDKKENKKKVDKK